MTVHHVNSKHYQLSTTDILLVAAHDHPDQAAMHYKDAKSPKNASPVQLMYTIFHQIYVNPKLLRMREGNTLFVIQPGKDGGCVMMVFDGDTPNNTIKNLATACEAARNLGFTKIVLPYDNHLMLQMGKRAFDKFHKPGDKFSSTKDLVVVELEHV